MPFMIACMVVSAGIGLANISIDVVDIMSAKRKIAKLRKQRNAE